MVGLVTSNALGQGLHLKMTPVFGDRRMARQTIGKAEQRAAMGLVAYAAFILHRPFCRKGFSLERHARMAGDAYSLCRFETVLLILCRKPVACGAVKRLHPADISGRLRVTGRALFRRGFDGVQRRQVTCEAFQVCPLDMKLVARRLADLRPVRLVVQMTLFAHPPIQFGVRRNIFQVRRCPTPNDTRSVLNVLLVAHVAVDFIVRSLLPGIPRAGHKVARGAKIRVVFDVVVGPVTGKGDSQYHGNDDGYQTNSNTGHQTSPGGITFRLQRDCYFLYLRT